MTPWGPIALVAIVTVGGSLAVLRLTGEPGYAWAYAFAALGVASALLGLIATVAFVWAVGLFVLAAGTFMRTRRTGAIRRS